MKLFDEDGDASREFECFLNGLDRDIGRFLQRSVDDGARRLELRAATERIINRVHVAALQLLVRTK